MARERARDRSTVSSVVWAAAADIGDRVQLSMVSMESSLSLDRAELDIRWTFFHHPMRLITLMFDRPTAYPILVIIECESFSDWVS